MPHLHVVWVISQVCTGPEHLLQHIRKPEIVKARLNINWHKVGKRRETVFFTERHPLALQGEKRKRKKKRKREGILLKDILLQEGMNVVVAGTFDVLHPGHLYLLEEAAKLGDVYVIIARDCNIRTTKKEKKIVFTEEERLRMMQGLKPVKKAILGDKNDFFKPIEEISPDYILLGPDQDEEWARSEVEKRNLDIKVKRLPERLPYSSSEIRHRLGCPDAD